MSSTASFPLLIFLKFVLEFAFPTNHYKKSSGWMESTPKLSAYESTPKLGAYALSTVKKQCHPTKLCIIALFFTFYYYY